MIKKILFSLMLTALIGVLAACNKDNEEDSNDVYFVKYEYQRSGGRITTQITYKDTDSERSFTMSGMSWQGTYGPFQRGDTVFMIVRSDAPGYVDWSNFTSNGTISISKNDEPFSVKIAGSGTLEYVIK